MTVSTLVSCEAVNSAALPCSASCLWCTKLAPPNSSAAMSHAATTRPSGPMTSHTAQTRKDTPSSVINTPAAATKPITVLSAPPVLSFGTSCAVGLSTAAGATYTGAGAAATVGCSIES